MFRLIPKRFLVLLALSKLRYSLTVDTLLAVYRGKTAYIVHWFGLSANISLKLNTLKYK